MFFSQNRINLQKVDILIYTYVYYALGFIGNLSVW